MSLILNILKFTFCSMRLLIVILKTDKKELSYSDFRLALFLHRRASFSSCTIFMKPIVCVKWTF